MIGVQLGMDIATNQPTLSRALFSRNSDEWATPQYLFDELDAEFHFDIDACASDLNHKCDEYYTKIRNGLGVGWGGKTVFCNPPYSDISRWVEKCYREGTKDNTTVVLLIPSRTDTTYFHNFIYHRAEIRFIDGRLKFEGAKWNAPFPSMIVIFRGAYSK